MRESEPGRLRTIEEQHPADLDVRIVTAPAPSRLHRAASSRRVRSILLAALVVVGLWRAFEVRAFVTPPLLTENDFTQDYVSAKEWRAGRDPYARMPDMMLRYFGPNDPTARQYEPEQLNPHSPAMIVLLAPLSALGMRGARAGLMVVELLAVFLAVLLFCRALGMSDAVSTALAIGALALPVVRYDVRWGNINALVLLGLVLAWRALRSGKDARAGLILGAVVAVKLFPIFLIIPLIRMRRAKAVTWTIGGTAAVSLIGFGALGLDAGTSWLTEAQPGNFQIWGAAPHSISLFAFPFRLLASSRWLTPGVHVSSLVGLLGLLIFAGCAIAAWKSSAMVSGNPFWSATPWMILASPISWSHYLVIVIPLGILMLRNAQTEKRRRVAIMVSFVVIAMGTSLMDNAAAILGFSLMRYGNVVAGMTVTMVALIAAARLDARPDVPSKAWTSPSARSRRNREIVLPA